METAEKYKLRDDLVKLKKHMKDKKKKYFAWIPMRDELGYYRGIWCEKKKDIEDYFPDVDITKVRLK